MNKYTLLFLDPLLELKYQKETEFEKVPRLFSLVKIELLLSFVCSIYSACKKESLDNMVAVVAVILITIMIYLIRRFIPCILKTFLLLIFFGFTILFTESIAEYRTSSGFSEISLALTIPLQLFTYSVLLTRFSWIFCSCYYIFGIIYLFLRITNLEDRDNKDIIILGLGLSMLSFAYMSYRQEQTFRNFYKSIHDSNQSLSHFKLLLQNIMPNPIFIVNYKKSLVEFLNKSASEMLSNRQMDMDHIASTNIVFKSRSKITERPSGDSNSSSDDLFNCYEKLLSFYKITENKEENDTPLAETLSNYYNTNELQQISTSDLLDEKEPIIKFLTLNTVSEASFDNSAFKTSKNKEKRRYFEIKIAKIGWEKQPCLLVIFNDNTNLRKIIELQNLDEYKNRLLATVSHDLRTPLNGLLGILEVVTPQISEQEAKNSLIIAQRSGNLLLYMINDFLDFSQIIYKKIRLNLELVNIHEIIKETAELIEFQAKKKNLAFLVNLNNVPIDFKIYIDGNRIKQILLNLLSNSLKFTQQGFIKLSVKMTKENTSTLKFSVKDSGIGIKESDKPKLFRLFSKLDQTDKEINKTGVGLGLTISQSLVKLLDGNKERGIGLKSESGKGSKFWFFVSSKDDEEENVFSRPESLKIKLPFIKTYTSSNSNLNFCPSEKEILMKNTGAPLSTRLLPLKSFSHKEKRILIVDDDLINLLIAQKYLEFYGLNYLTANNGQEAFETIKTDIIKKEYSITLILMDCNMPILDGFQASVKILNFLKDEGLPEMPIIAVTANVEVADQEKCYQAGMKKLLTKPVKRKDLGVVLQNYLKINLSDADPIFL